MGVFSPLNRAGMESVVISYWLDRFGRWSIRNRLALLVTHGGRTSCDVAGLAKNLPKVARFPSRSANRQSKIAACVVSITRSEDSAVLLQNVQVRWVP